ncbi:hypothetical protein EDD15DRAFT_2124760, partial [Pisolithus albus]
HECPHCHISLLMGECPGFCCGPNGSHLHDVSPFPPLPPQTKLLTEVPQISQLSCILNLLVYLLLSTKH